MTDVLPDTPTVDATDNNLTINDLVIMLSVIQATAARGAIKAEEMAVTGALHDKLKRFLEANGVTQNATPAAPAQAPTA